MIEIAMSPAETRRSAERGRATAATYKPLYAEQSFRFPIAVKDAAKRFGEHTAAEIALECSKPDVRTLTIPGGMTAVMLAQQYVAQLMANRSI